MSAAPHLLPPEDFPDLFDLFKVQAPGFERMDEALDFCFPTTHGRMSYDSWACRLIQEAPADRASAFLASAPWSEPREEEEGNQPRLEAAAEALGAALSQRVFRAGFGEQERALAELALSRLGREPAETPARVAEAFLNGALARCDVHSEPVQAFVTSVPGMLASSGMAPGKQGQELAISAIWGALRRGVDNAFLLEWSARQEPESDWGQALRTVIAYGFERSAWGMLSEFLDRFGQAAATRAQWDGAEGIWEREAAKLSWAMAASESLLTGTQQDAARSGSCAPASLRDRPAFISAMESLALEGDIAPAASKPRLGL